MINDNILRRILTYFPKYFRQELRIMNILRINYIIYDPPIFITSYLNIIGKTVYVPLYETNHYRDQF